MKYGLCCISLELADKNISFQTMTWKKYSSLSVKDGDEILGSKILNNLRVTKAHIKLCAEKNWNYRISSDIFPIVTHPDYKSSLENIRFYPSILKEFEEIANFVKSTNIRLSCHPDQYNVIASSNENTISQSIKEINFQSWVMDMMGCPTSHEAPINLHMNSSSDNIWDITYRFHKNFEKLSENARKRFVLENEDKGKWTVKNLSDHFWNEIPITFDYLHHQCNSGDVSEEKAIEICCSSWKNITPLFHYSESIPGDPNPRKHANYPLRAFNTYNRDFDVDFEFKMKDKAISAFSKS